MKTNTLTLTATTSGDDIYQFTGSFGIAHAAAESKATKIERLGSGEAQPGNVNSRSTFFRISGGQAGEGVLCCTTNGDPLWEEEDLETFAAHAEACGVELTASSQMRAWRDVYKLSAAPTATWGDPQTWQDLGAALVRAARDRDTPGRRDRGLGHDELAAGLLELLMDADEIDLGALRPAELRALRSGVAAERVRLRTPSAGQVTARDYKVIAQAKASLAQQSAAPKGRKARAPKAERAGEP